MDVSRQAEMGGTGKWEKKGLRANVKWSLGQEGSCHVKRVSKENRESSRGQ